MEITEFDEQIDGQESALIILAGKITEYRNNRETIGVVSGYERAALSAGCSPGQIEALWQRQPTKK